MKGKTAQSKRKKKPEKTVYTYREYMEKLRPKSLGRVEDADNTLADCDETLNLQKACTLPYDYPVGRV